MASEKTQLVVIGGGPGGYAAAFRAADLGLQVALVDVEANPGGVCLYRGCIPSKALLHVAKVINESKEAGHWGVEFSAPKINIEKMQGWKDDVVKKLTGGLGLLSKQRKINYIQGRASFTDSSTLIIHKTDGTEMSLSFDNAIIATGSRPATLPDGPLESQHLLNSTDALNLKEIPKTMLVIGGGYIGLELGSVYASIGSKVTVVEMGDGLLPGADRDLVTPLAKRLEKLLHKIYLSSKVESLKEGKKGITVTFSNAQGKIEETFDKVLVSIGRKPNSSGLGLNATKVQVSDRGFIVVDANRRTADPKIYAIGDVVGDPMLAHKASHEAMVAVECIVGKNTVFQPMAIPAVVFTDPEIAWCGLTESDAKKQNKEIKVAKFPWAASGRALTLDRTEGLTKVIVDPKTERILGVGIVGPGAGDLIAEGVLAIEMGATALDVALTIHAHPTLSETMMEASEVYYGHCVHLLTKKK